MCIVLLITALFGVARKLICEKVKMACTKCVLDGARANENHRRHGNLLTSGTLLKDVVAQLPVMA